MSGLSGQLWQSGIEAQESTALGEKLFRVVSEKAEVANTHEAFRDYME